MEVIATWEGGYRCRVPIRGFEVVSDEPSKYGGTDTGPMPTELLLASLAVCFAMAVAHAARKRSIELSDLSVAVRGRYERLGFDRLEVEVRSTHPRAELEPLVERAIGYCYVTNTLQNEPEIEFSIADRDLSGAPEEAPGPGA